MQKKYKTISNEAVCEIKEKKSKFICSAKPVATEADAVSFINSIKNKYWDATHNVYAYRIGDNIQKFSDDREPVGTAGLPVLETIKKLNIQDIVVVVTRYFGGILLGAKGLVRAYSKSAQLAIESAQIVDKLFCTKVSIRIEYPMLSKIQNSIFSNEYILDTILYQECVNMVVYIPIDIAPIFLKHIYEITNGNASVEIGQNEYIIKKIKER